MSIGWYPGHMHKARKDITQVLQQVDAVLEIADARLPYASTNPLLQRLIGDTPRLRVLTRADLADPVASARWLDWHRRHALPCLLLAKDDNDPAKRVLSAIAPYLQPRAGRPNRILVLGIPNVGKSTLINLLAGRRIAKVGNEPAVTKARQEIRLNRELVLYDTPGILWPKLDDQQAAYRLAASGAIRNTAIELDDIGLFVTGFLQQRYPGVLRERYGIDNHDQAATALLDAIGRRRGCLSKGGVDFTKAGEVLVNDLRTGKLGRLSLETPDDIPAPASTEERVPI